MSLGYDQINKIENEALIFAEQRPTDDSEQSRIYKSGCSFGYANGAINEAERAEVWKQKAEAYERALKDILDVPAFSINAGTICQSISKEVIEQFK